MLENISRHSFTPWSYHPDHVCEAWEHHQSREFTAIGRLVDNRLVNSGTEAEDRGENCLC